MLKIILGTVALAFFFVMFLTSMIEGETYGKKWLELKIATSTDNKFLFSGYLKNIVAAIVMLSFSIGMVLLLIKEIIKW